MKPVISVHNLSKLYHLGAGSSTAAAGGYRTLREWICDVAAQPLRRLRSKRDGGAGTDADADLWALRDVSFDVRPGEVVGIVGRNGAGKSTLLKVLSRIVNPTTGRVELHGRVGS